MNTREQFLDIVRDALRRGTDANSEASSPPDFGPSPRDPADVESRVQQSLDVAERDGAALMIKLQESAERAGCVVSPVQSLQEAREYIGSVVRSLEAHLVVRSSHVVLDRMGIDGTLSEAGVELMQTASSEGGLDPQSLRDQVAQADTGITGVDYAIAETGSCVIIPGPGVSRMVSLLPPVHVAVVEAGQVLPSLDELFLLRRRDFLRGETGGYMNIITGPSRSADIEYTIVKGVHGPGEVHLVLIG